MKSMKGSFSFVKNLFKRTAVSTAMLSMVVSPLAQGAEAKARASTVEYNYQVDKKSIQEFLKYSGLNKKHLTIGEFHSKMRPYYPKTLRDQMDQWAQIHRNEFMPEVEATTYKDSDGKERVRLILTQDGMTVTASYNPDNNAKFVKLNNVYLTKDDMKFHEQAIRKIVLGDKGIKSAVMKAPKSSRMHASVALSYEEFSRLTPRQRAEYLVRLRYVLQDAQQVMEKYHGPQAANELNHDFFVKWLLLGEEAEAKGKKSKGSGSIHSSDSIRSAVPGDPCVVSGYLVVYGNDYSCGGTGPGRKALIEEMAKYGGGQCKNGSVSCNPLVYGYQSDGSAICVKNGKNNEIQTSTSVSCPQQSHLKTAEDKKRIIESYLKVNGNTDAEKNLNLIFDKDGKISKAQFDLIKEHLDKLNQYVENATQVCSVEPLSKTRKTRLEQNSACVALATRKIDILPYPETPIPPVIIPEKDCSQEKPGSTLENGECNCGPGTHAGTITEDGQERPACIPDEIAGGDTKKECNKDEKRDEKTGECIAAAGTCAWCPWAIGAGIFAAVGGILFWIFHDKDHKPSPAPVSPDPCPPSPQICLPPGTPATVTPAGPPPIQPAPPATTTTTGTTTPDPLPTPAVTPFVEPVNGTSSSTTGGVR
ncbi:MAG: hypothetical protein ACXVB1_15855 [Pseudobdellovibrionaceae bacterium]